VVVVETAALADYTLAVVSQQIMAAAVAPVRSAMDMMVDHSYFVEVRSVIRLG